MNITDILNAINGHRELAATFDCGVVSIEKVDDSVKLNSELIADFIERLVGREIMNHLTWTDSDESAACAYYKLNH